MRERNKGQFASSLTALLLLGIFAVGILSVLLSGAGAYRRLTQRDQAAYESRTCVQYLATKIRQNPRPDTLALTEFGAGESLLFTQDVRGEEYWVRIYCHDGWLMELFTAAEEGFAPEDGEKIMPIQSLSLQREDDLLRAEVVDANGVEHTLVLALRGGEGAEE